MGKKESVWDYPRPPRLEDFNGELKVVFSGITIAHSQNGYRVLETSHPPVYYIPKEDVKTEFLKENNRTSLCEFKGIATYWDLKVGERLISNAAWSYEKPTSEFLPIAGYLAFYAEKVDACYVDGEKVAPQEGNFYGGWITRHIRGPFKGAPGTKNW